MRRLAPVLLAITSTLPVTDAYAFAFLREKAHSLHVNHPIHEYNSTDPKPCQRINYLLDTGPVTGIRFWTNRDLGRAPWAFLFYADSQACDHHGNIPALVVYCNKPVENPYSFQLADFENLKGLVGNGGGMWTLKSWEEVEPNTPKWRLFIEDMNLVPGQMAVDRVGRWGDYLAAVDGDVARVKMWVTPTDRFDRPQAVLRDEGLMEEELGEGVGFERYSRGLDEAPFVTNQAATEKWAGVFGIGDIRASELVGGDPRRVVKLPATEKWAAIFGVGGVEVPPLGGMGGLGRYINDMELEEGDGGSVDSGEEKEEQFGEEVLSGGNSVKGEYNGGSMFEVPVQIKVEDEGVDWLSSSDNQGDNDDAPPSDTIPGLGNLEPDSESQRINQDPLNINSNIKEEPASARGEPALSTMPEPVEKIEATSNAIQEEEREEITNRYPRPVKQEVNSLANEPAQYGRQSNLRGGIKEEIELEDPQADGVGYGSMLSELIGNKPLERFTPMPLHAITGLEDFSPELAMGLSDNLQRQYEIADRGIRELGCGKWDWRNRRQMNRILKELGTTKDVRSLRAKRRQRELPSWKRGQLSLSERLPCQVAVGDEEDEAEDGSQDLNFDEEESPRRVRKPKVSQQEIVDLLVPASQGQGRLKKKTKTE
ncbi:hypothetical protein TWF481_000162 [Arthrobotrys musiformis]|uniref:Uncharacterized protein n=1 Tax=Arthrobotrys musiformis TaxID=47236 RepID=A0AAV9WLZ4_9PEZI